MIGIVKREDRCEPNRRKALTLQSAAILKPDCEPGRVRLDELITGGATRNGAAGTSPGLAAANLPFASAPPPTFAVALRMNLLLPPITLIRKPHAKVL